MRQNDRPRIEDISASLRLLTRLPMPANRGLTCARSAWAWPLAGLVVGAVSAAFGIAALPLGPGVAAAVVLGAQAMLTGAMHEDGLADCADGFWGGWERERRLAIMKDSHIGSYGVVALLVVGLIRWSALSALLGSGHGASLIGVAALSRVPMAAVMAALPNARDTGLSRSVGRPGWAGVGLATILGLAIMILFAGWAGLAAASAMALTTGAVIVLAWTRIGGQTGDVLGASQQLADAAALAVVASLVA